MLSSSQSGKELSAPEPVSNAVLVREQLRRLLAHPLFTNSKRYPVLLAYAVEQTLAGNASGLKERTIGVEAFGRDPAYDVNLDPVVRMTAAEVRKRLVQYYYNPKHAGQLVIEMPVGSYVPSFRDPLAHQPGSPATAVELGVGPSNRKSVPAPALHANAQQGRSKPAVRPWISIPAALVLAALIGFGIGRFKLPNRPSNLERFWEPISSASSRVTYCLGEPVESPDNPQLLAPGTHLYGGLDVTDVTTLTRAIVPLVPRNAPFRVVAASQTEFAQLREGPIVLIGAFDNPWTMRITQDLPFGFEYDNNHIRRIIDRKSAPKRFWELQWQVPNSKLAVDYAIVARIHDNITGQPVIILAGILAPGTEAAGEVASNPAHLNAMLQKAAKNWDQMNLEAVIETRVIEGHSSPPTVVAVHTW